MSSEDLRTELAVLRNELQHILAAVQAIREDLHSWRVDHEARLRNAEGRLIRLEERLDEADKVAAEYRRLRIGIVVAVVSTLVAALATVFVNYVH